MSNPWYGTARWQRRRADQLAAYPLCRMCQDAGRVTVATVADHITPHRGDPVAFWTGPLQSLCKPHHDRDKQIEERGDRPGVDADGWPLGR